MSVMAQAGVWVWGRVLVPCLGLLTKGPACSAREKVVPEMPSLPRMWSVMDNEAGGTSQLSSVPRDAFPNC